MNVITYHDLTQQEYAGAVVTSVTGGSTWMRAPRIYGDASVWFVAAETPMEIVRAFARGVETIRVQVIRQD